MEKNTRLLLILILTIALIGLFIDESMPTTETIFKEKNNKMLFVIHGMTGTPKPYQLMAENIEATVYVPLLKNHGKKLSDLRTITMQEIKADIENDLIEKKENYEITLLGTSSGGLIAMELAQKYNLPVIIINTPIEKTNLNFLTILPYFYRIDYGLWKDKKAKQYHTSFNKYPTHFLKEIYDYKIPDITVPILIVQSKDDFRGKGGENFYQRISSENKELLIMENSGHLPFIDKEKDLLFNKINKFIKW